MNSQKLYVVGQQHAPDLMTRAAQQPSLLDRKMIEERMESLDIGPGHWYIREGLLWIRWAEQEFPIAPFGHILNYSYQELATLLDNEIQKAVVQARRDLRQVLVRGIQSGQAQDWRATLEQMAKLLNVPTRSLELAL